MTQMSPGSAPTTTAAVEMLANGQLLAGDLETAATGPGRRATTSGRRAARYFLRRVVANVLVVLPISLLFIALIAGVFGQGINPAAGGLLGFGLVAAVLGLTAFTEGLRLSVMPLGKVIGANIVQRLGLAVTLIVVLFIAVLIT